MLDFTAQCFFAALFELFLYLEHGRDITLLIVLLISCTTPACFSTFYRCAMVLTLVKIFNFLCTCLSTF